MQLDNVTWKSVKNKKYQLIYFISDNLYVKNDILIKNCWIKITNSITFIDLFLTMHTVRLNIKYNLLNIKKIRI